MIPMTRRAENAFYGHAEVVVRNIVIRATTLSGPEIVEAAMATAAVTSLIDTV